MFACFAEGRPGTGQTSDGFVEIEPVESRLN